MCVIQYGLPPGCWVMCDFGWCVYCGVAQVPRGPATARPLLSALAAAPPGSPGGAGRAAHTVGGPRAGLPALDTALSSGQYRTRAQAQLRRQGQVLRGRQQKNLKKDFKKELEQCLAAFKVRQVRLGVLVHCSAAGLCRSSLVATPQGVLPKEDVPLLDALPASCLAAPRAAPSGRAGPALPCVPLQLLSLCQPLAGGSVLGGVQVQGGSVQGLGRLQGAVEGVSYAHKREPWGRVAADIKVCRFLCRVILSIYLLPGTFWAASCTACRGCLPVP